jgi:hypothetical protein
MAGKGFVAVDRPCSDSFLPELLPLGGVLDGHAKGRELVA